MKISVFYQHVQEATVQTGRPVDAILEEIKKACITGLELGMDQLEDPAPMKTLLEKHGLTVSSIYANFAFESSDDPAPGRALVDTAVYLGCPRIMPVPGFFPEGSDHEQIREHMIRPVAELVAYAASKNITVTMEDYDNYRSPIATAEGMKYFADRVPGLGYTFDCGNFIYSGQDEGEAFDLLQDKIYHVHCKDRYATSLSGEKPLIAVTGKALYPCPYGSGIIRTDEILTRLKAQDYDGWLAIEHFGAADHLGYMLKSAEYLKKYL